MCGIVGAFSTNGKYPKSALVSFFRQALFADTFRGEDSTGIAIMGAKSTQPEVYKKALAAPDFLQLKKVEALLDPPTGGIHFMLGHNRAATKGGVNDDTAHPFQEGNITLVHNGTVTNHRTLPDGNSYDVDSEAICHAISVQGLEATVKELLGAFTLVWHDAEDGTLNFIRNDERPLWVVPTDDGEELLLASEGAMLHWIATRNGIKIDKLFSPAVGQHYKYHVGQFKEWAKKPTVTKVALRPKPVIGYTGHTTTTTTTSQSRASVSQAMDVICRRAEGSLNKNGIWEVMVTPTLFTENQTQYGGATMGYVTFRGLTSKDSLTTYTMHNMDKEAFDEMYGQAVIAEVLNAFYDGVPAGSAKVILNNRANAISIFDDPVIKANIQKEAQTTSKKPNESSSQKSNTQSTNTKDVVDDIIAYKAAEIDQELKDSEYRTYEGPDSKIYTEKAITNLIGMGCCKCSGDIPLEDVDEGYVEWFGDYPICRDCTLDDLAGVSVH